MKLFRLTTPSIIALFGLLSLITACSDDKDAANAGAKGKRSGKVNAEAFIVKQESFSNNYTASGSLLPNEEIEIHPEMSGRVTSLNFKEGSVVRKGQLLVQLYDADLRAQLQRLHAQRRLQQSTEGRQKELVSIGGISKQEYEATQTQTKYVDADIAVAEAALTKMKIVAPFDGVVGLRNISIGAVVSPATIVATLQQVHTLKMDFNVPDQYKSQLVIGQKVFFSVDGNQDTLTGTISAIEPGADAATRTIKARAIVPNPNNKLSAGGFAHVVVPLAVNQNAILVPTQSIIPTTRDKKVARVKDGKAEMIVVKTGIRTSGKVEITQGLQTGDTILTTALMQVKAGDSVSVKKIVL